MKKSFTWILLGLVAMSLAACAAPEKAKTYRSIKCPSCGYEFKEPAK